MVITNQIAIIKLVSGEEIIGTIKRTGDGESLTNENLSVSFPLSIMFLPEGRVTVRPWIFCKECKDQDSEIMINPLSIMAIGTPTDDLISAYEEYKNQTRSNLIKATKEQQSIITNVQ